MKTIRDESFCEYVDSLNPKEPKLISVESQFPRKHSVLYLLNLQEIHNLQIP